MIASDCRCTSMTRLLILLALLTAVVSWPEHFAAGSVAALVVTGYCGARWLEVWRNSAGRDRSRRDKQQRAPRDVPDDRPPRAKKAADPTDVASLVEQMFDEGRFSLLLRAELIENLSSDQRQRAEAALADGMSLVPQGEIVLGLTPGSGDDAVGRDEPPTGVSVHVEHFYLDRYPVTNRQFHEFVAAGGYQQMAIWNAEILPGLLDFVDETGAPGPRFWRDGCYRPGTADHPVVGVSWYEADAYARWVGKRLPSDPEWEKAGSWPVQMSATARPQRRYPWGEAMDLRRCNLWGSGHGGTLPVFAQPEGASVGGVYQLVGNVWEWTCSPFGSWVTSRDRLVLPVAMKSIRGGAFDTYFENQATCQFQSGEDPLARKRNVGFRCALSGCDVAGPFHGASVVETTHATVALADHEPSPTT